MSSSSERKMLSSFKSCLMRVIFASNKGLKKTSHLKLYGVSVLFLQAPSHIASVLLVFTSRPEVCLNSLRSFKRLITDWWSLTNTVVSSANWVTFISFPPTTMPFMSLLLFKALARSSIPITSLPDASMQIEIKGSLEQPHGMNCLHPWVTCNLVFFCKVYTFVRRLHAPEKLLCL